MGVIEDIKRVALGPWVPANQGRAPYLWLFSLLFMLWKYAYVHPSVGEAILLTLTLATFLMAYLRSYWVSNLRLLPYLLFVVGLGVVWAPYNAGASTFFIYGAAMCARIGRQRLAYAGVALIMGLALFVSRQATPRASFLVPVLVAGTLVGIASIMEENVRKSNQRLARKQEEIEHLTRIAERERISRDLHDLLGHTLSMITLKAELAGKLLDRDPAASRAEIKDIELTARKALSEVRSAVTGIRQTGMARELATARASLAAADVDFTASVQPLALPASVENVLSLALREAVTNILRHADATRCDVRIELADGMVVLRVRDDGRALARGGAIVHGNGLSGMRERVAQLGGRLAVRVDRGLALELSLPLVTAA